VYDNFVHFQHCELALLREVKEKKMSQTRDRKRSSAPLPTKKRATLKTAVYGIVYSRNQSVVCSFEL